MPRDLILGTAGHIDHGKTSLVKALTGIDCDRLPEEKARGITIDIGFAILDLGDFRLGIVDVPGHERFIKNMLAGATGIDLAMLVVAACYFVAGSLMGAWVLHLVGPRQPTALPPIQVIAPSAAASPLRRATTIAKHLRLNSSIMVSILIGLPS